MVFPKMIAAGLAAILAASVSPVSAQVASAEAVDQTVVRIMERTGAEGLAIAVIENGQVAYVRAYGQRNAAGDPLTTTTIMYGASLTKTVFGYAVMQMVDDGLIDLDRPVSAALPDLPQLHSDHIEEFYSDWRGLADDDRWLAITPRHLLTHSAGFANFYWLESDSRIRIHFDPGSRYAYSGDGMMLLQFMIEHGMGIDVGARLDARVFGPLGMANTSLKWRPEFAANLADGWTADGSIEPHDERSKVRVAGSMDTTITDIGLFAAALIRGEGLSSASRAEMVRAQLPITTASQFPTFQPELPVQRRRPDLAAGLGLIVFEGPQGRGFFKGGHNDSTGNTLVCLESGQRCVVILANDVRAEAGFAELVQTVLGDTGVPYDWEYGTGP